MIDQLLHIMHLYQRQPNNCTFNDMKTGGLGRNADIPQIAITQENKVPKEDLNVFVLLT